MKKRNQSNPCCNRLLKLKLQLQDINRNNNQKEEIDDFNSNNGYFNSNCNLNGNDLNDFLSSCLSQKGLMSTIKTPRNETKSSNPFSSNSHRKMEQYKSHQQQQLKQQQQKQRLHQSQSQPQKHIIKQSNEMTPNKRNIIHLYDKHKRYFSGSLNQYNIQNKIRHNKQYNAISSFELKLNKELQRISNSYKKEDLRKVVYKNDSLSSLLQFTPNYELYKDIKSIENRFSGKAYKAKLLPITYKPKDNFNKLAKRFYNQSCNLMQKKPYLNN